MYGLMDLTTTIMMQSIMNPDPLGQYLTRELHRPITPILGNPCMMSSDIVFASIFLLYSNSAYDHPFYTICGFEEGNAIIQIDMTPLVYSLGGEPPRYGLPIHTNETDISITKNRLHETGQWVHTDNMLTVDGNCWSKHVFDYSKYEYIGTEFDQNWEFRNNRLIECFRSSAQSGTFIPNTGRVYNMDFPFKTPQFWTDLNIGNLYSNLTQDAFPIMYGTYELVYDAPLEYYNGKQFTLRVEGEDIECEKQVFDINLSTKKTQYVDKGYLTHKRKEDLDDFGDYKGGRHVGWEPLNSPLGSLTNDYMRLPTNPAMSERPLRTTSYGQDIKGVLSLFGNGDVTKTVEICGDNITKDSCYINLGTSTHNLWVDELIGAIGTAFSNELKNVKKLENVMNQSFNFSIPIQTHSLTTALEVDKLFAWFFHKGGQQLLQSNSSLYSEHFSRHKLYQKLVRSESYKWSGSSSSFIKGEKLVFLENDYTLEFNVKPILLYEDTNFSAMPSYPDDLKIVTFLRENFDFPFTQYYSSLGVYKCMMNTKKTTHTSYFDMFCTDFKLTPTNITKVFEKDITFEDELPDYEDYNESGMNEIVGNLSVEKYAFTPQICKYQNKLAFYSNYFVYVYFNLDENPYFDVYAIKKIHEAELSHQIISNWEKTFIQLWETRETQFIKVASTREEENE